MRKIIGLTGGIACGKSTVSRYLAQKGAQIVDADQIAHELSEPNGALYEAYQNHWGKQVLLADGTLNRRKVGQLAFANYQEKNWLNHTAHPVIKEAIERKLSAIKSGVIILDVPLLFEAGWDKITDGNCVVFVIREIQLQRLIARNGYTRQEALNRINAQMPLNEKKRRADWLIDNSGSLEETYRQADTLWQKWKT